jgi:hypothetical protein
MESVVQELNTLINDFTAKLRAMEAADFETRPQPHKWSKKEVIGHLVDSAQNNLRRFIVSTYAVTPPNIVYDQDVWVRLNGYQSMLPDQVVTLWSLVNQQILAVLQQLPPDDYSKACDTGKDKQQLHSLLWLAEDYVKHMKHHLNQVFPGTFSIAYKS